MFDNKKDEKNRVIGNLDKMADIDDKVDQDPDKSKLEEVIEKAHKDKPKKDK